MEQEQNPIIKWPYGLATICLMTAVGAQALSIANNLTIVDGSSIIATGNRTLDLTADAGLEPGARVLVKTTTTATERLSPGVSVKGESITGVAGKTQVVEYVYDGTYFIQAGKSIQID